MKQDEKIELHGKYNVQNRIVQVTEITDKRIYYREKNWSPEFYLSKSDFEKVAEKQ